MQTKEKGFDLVKTKTFVHDERLIRLEITLSNGKKANMYFDNYRLADFITFLINSCTDFGDVSNAISGMERVNNDDDPFVVIAVQ